MTSGQLSLCLSSGKEEQTLAVLLNSLPPLSKAIDGKPKSECEMSKEVVLENVLEDVSSYDNSSGNRNVFA